jgi:hypothetical protein
MGETAMLDLSIIKRSNAVIGNQNAEICEHCGESHAGDKEVREQLKELFLTGKVSVNTTILLTNNKGK